MKFGKLYTDWIRYLKKVKLYGSYRIAYSTVANFLSVRNEAIHNGMYWNDYMRYCYISTITNIPPGNDTVIKDKGDAMSFHNLQYAMSVLEQNIYGAQGTRAFRMLSELGCVRRWMDIALRFGEETGYYTRPRFTGIQGTSATFSGTLYGESSITIQNSLINELTAHDITVDDRRSRFDRAHEGQWFDRFNNRGRNNFNNNIRWRRR